MSHSIFRDDILAYAEQGWTTLQIATQLGCSTRWVREVRHDPSRRVRIHNWDMVVELTRQGCSARDIADKLGMSKHHVGYIRTKTHTNVHTKAPLLSDEDVQRAMQMLDDGASYAEIQRTLGHAFNTRIPGRGWTREQTNEYICATRRLKKEMHL